MKVCTGESNIFCVTDILHCTLKSKVYRPQSWVKSLMPRPPSDRIPLLANLHSTPEGMQNPYGVFFKLV